MERDPHHPFSTIEKTALYYVNNENDNVESKQ